MNLSLRQLRYVVAAADTGHVTAAAKRLNVSQPSISSAIAELEAEIGVPLFIRHHARGVTLTPVGERVVNEARLLLKHAQDFAQIADNSLAALASLTGQEIAGLTLTLALLGVAVVTGIALVRTRAHAAQIETAAQENAAALRADLEQLKTLLLSEPPISLQALHRTHARLRAEKGLIQNRRCARRPRRKT